LISSQSDTELCGQIYKFKPSVITSNVYARGQRCSATTTDLLSWASRRHAPHELLRMNNTIFYRTSACLQATCTAQYCYG